MINFLKYFFRNCCFTLDWLYCVANFAGSLLSTANVTVDKNRDLFVRLVGDL